MTRQLLFVAMPFGRKRDPSGRIEIDFDAVYEQAIKPAAADAHVEVIRADEERGGGIIHKPMYERLLLAEIVIADLTFANANVFYELGIRHAARPRATILIFAAIGTLPFDVAPIRSLSYKVEDDGQFTAEAATRLRTVLTERLRLAKASQDKDSPLFELLPEYVGSSLPHESTETFRDRARAASELTERMRAAAEAEDADALRAIEDEIGDLGTASPELPVDLLLAYRDVSAWADMIRCVEAMPATTREVVTVREQHALAPQSPQRSGRPQAGAEDPPGGPRALRPVAGDVRDPRTLLQGRLAAGHRRGREGAGARRGDRGLQRGPGRRPARLLPRHQPRDAAARPRHRGGPRAPGVRHPGRASSRSRGAAASARATTGIARRDSSSRSSPATSRWPGGRRRRCWPRSRRTGCCRRRQATCGCSSRRAGPRHG